MGSPEAPPGGMSSRVSAPENRRSGTKRLGAWFLRRTGSFRTPHSALRTPHSMDRGCSRLEGGGRPDMVGGFIEWLERLGRFADFAGRAIAAIPVALVRRSGEVARQFERVAWGSLPILVVAGVSVGLVTWLQTRRLLVRYGAEATLPSFSTAA